MRFPLEYRGDGWHILAIDEHGRRDLGSIGRVTRTRAYAVRGIVSDAWARGWVQGHVEAEARARKQRESQIDRTYRKEA